MKITREEDAVRQTVLHIEMEETDLDGYLQRAYQRVVQKMKVPGFRPGKAPRRVVERMVGRESLLHEAFDFMVPEVTARAIEQEDIEAGAQPDVEIVEMEPVTIKATVPLTPLVETGDYLSMRVPWTPPALTEERIEEALEEARRKEAVWEPVERAAAMGDDVALTFKGVVEGETVVDQEYAAFVLDSEAPVAGFGDALTGITLGETREFDLPFPEDYVNEALAGKTCTFTVTAKEIKAQVLPELDDEFAKGVDDGYESLDALKDHLRRQLQEALEHEDEHTYQDAVMSELLGVGSVELPPIMVERAIDNHLQEIQDTIGQRIGRSISLEEYLDIMRKSEEELREETRVTVEEQLRRSYLITQVAEAEGIEPKDEDVAAEIEDMATRAGDQGEQVRQLFMSQENRDSLARSIRSRRTVQRLVEIAKSDAAAGAPADETVADETPQPEYATPEESPDQTT